MTSERACAWCRCRPVDERWRPFCSERCKQLDLAAWAEGRYRIAGDRVAPAAPGTTSADAHPPER